MGAAEAPLTGTGVHFGLAAPTSAVKSRYRCDGDTQPALPGEGLPKVGAGVGPYSPAQGGNRVEPYPNRSRGKVYVRWSPSPEKTPVPSTNRSEKPGGHAPNHCWFPERHQPAGSSPQSGSDGVPIEEAHSPDTRFVRFAYEAGMTPLMKLHGDGYGQRPNSWSDVSCPRLAGRVPTSSEAPARTIETTRPVAGSHDTPAKLTHTLTDAPGTSADAQFRDPVLTPRGLGKSSMEHMPRPSMQSPFQVYMLRAKYKSPSTLQSTASLAAAHPKGACGGGDGGGGGRGRAHGLPVYPTAQTQSMSPVLLRVYVVVPLGAAHGGGGAHAPPGDKPSPEPTLHEAPEYPGAQMHVQPDAVVYSRRAPLGGMQSGGTASELGATSHTTDAPAASARQSLPASDAAGSCSGGVAQLQPFCLSYWSSCPAAHVGGIIAEICACRLARLSGGGLGGGGLATAAAAASTCDCTLQQPTAANARNSALRRPTGGCTRGCACTHAAVSAKNSARHTQTSCVAKQEARTT